MKEIHAYRNEDGTYRVEILGTACTTRLLGKNKVKELIESKTEIPRASIQITPYVSKEGEEKIFSLILEDDYQ